MRTGLSCEKNEAHEEHKKKGRGCTNARKEMEMEERAHLQLVSFKHRRQAQIHSLLAGKCLCKVITLRDRRVPKEAARHLAERCAEQVFPGGLAHAGTARVHQVMEDLANPCLGSPGNRLLAHLLQRFGHALYRRASAS